MDAHLGMNMIYATKRWPEPDVWGRQIGERWGLKYVQFVFDLLDPRTVPDARTKYCEEVRKAAARYRFQVHNCFIGVAAYTYNYLLHPFAEMRQDALDWCEKASLCSQEMESRGVGGPIAAASMRDYTDPAKRDWLLDTLVEGIREFARIAAAHGQDFVLWEPSPVGREMGTSIDTVKDLYERFNADSPIPVHLQIDVGHWCGYEQQGKDADLDAWLAELGQFSPVMHLQQMDGQADCHWSFSKEKNAQGVIDMGKVLETLDKSGCKEVYMFPELAFPYEMDESQVLAEMDESVEYLKRFF
ncbi:MAG: sugar phosphate isomerase/epimerase [Candidatus Brocadiae bacterium]|nr:sugar phosphate isomerase/epimerase [Candidatus Brocadiia bacterium]